MPSLNQTHDPDLRSWVESANDPASEFPIQNLPYGVVLRDDDDERIGVAIGDQILDLMLLSAAGLLDTDDEDDPLPIACSFETLNILMALTPEHWSRLRARLSELLSEGCSELRDHAELREAAFVNQADVEMVMPCEVGDYTDFYASVHHATNVGTMFRPDNPLLPNYKWIPIGYHGRASSLGVSGMPVRRPVGQLIGEDGVPRVAPCALLDHELEVGVFVGHGNELGEPIPIGEARDRVFGLCLLNDWSARDMQKWEYQPLGPFLAKSFATTLSPWVVTAEALAPFRCAAETRPEGDPEPLAYLHDETDQREGGFDVVLEVWLRSASMREQGQEAIRLSTGNFKRMYWTVQQMLAHHSSNGCNLMPGDLLGSGTVSGPERESRGCMLELTWDGDAANPVPGTQRTPIVLPSGEERKFLADGDEIILRGFAQRDGYARIGFGECRAIVQPARH